MFLRTSRTSAIGGAARLAGPREAHPDVTFPKCAGCGFATSPVFRIDFRVEPFASLAVWPDPFVALICHNRCDSSARDVLAGSCRWWDHGEPLRPVELDPATIVTEQELLLDGLRDLITSTEARGADASMFEAMLPRAAPPPDDIEFEELAVSVEPRLTNDPDTIDLSSRVGGEPAWLQTGFRVGDDGTIAAADPDPPACPRCTKPTVMLLQWSEAGMDAIPRRVLRADGQWRPDDGHVMGNPFVRFWFGCAPCRLVGSLAQLD